MNLELRCGRRNIRIESRARCCDQVDRDRSIRVLRLQFGNVSIDAGNQLRVGWSQVRTSRGGGVVACGARCRGARMEVSRPGKGLANQARTGYCSTACVNQVAIGLL